MVLRDFPLLIFIVSLLSLVLSVRIGDAFRSRARQVEESEKHDFGVVLAAVLTLLGLIIGFSFSMAVSRYDIRKNYEQSEAAAINNEYVRADLLPAREAAATRELLKKYLDQRVLFYTTRSPSRLRSIKAETARLHNELWSVTKPAVTAQPAPWSALVLSGVNDIVSSHGYTQAAWRNRIPVAAWVLMLSIAICCSFLIGYGAHRRDWLAFMVVPVAVSISFFLIADIDSPRGGTIRVNPQNLITLSESLNAR